MLRTTHSALFFSAAIVVAGVAACGGNGSSADDSREAFTGTPSADGGDSSSSDGGTADSGATDGGASSSDASSQGMCLPAPSLSVCSDGQIVAILHESAMGEVALAQAVLPRLSDANAKAFAQKMINDHTASDMSLQSTAKMAGITAVENGLSQEIADSAKDEIMALSSKTGSDLDRSYMRHEVLDHLGDLAVSDHVVAPSVKNATLAMAALTDRALVAMHLQLATSIVGSLEGACGGMTSTGSDAGTGGDSGGGASDPAAE
jgi:putative membrane protein